MMPETSIQAFRAAVPGSAQMVSINESQAWLVLAALFGYPDTSLLEALRSGALRRHLQETFDAIDPALFTPLPEQAFWIPDEAGALAVEYTRLFYLGNRDTPLCALHEGAHRGNRMEVMEEVLRFYHHFGLSVEQTPNEMPDHLVSELEFLHFLSFQEARCHEHEQDAGPYERARRDFLLRHAGHWMSDIGNRLTAMDVRPFYRDSGHLLERFIQHQLTAS